MTFLRSRSAPRPELVVDVSPPNGLHPTSSLPRNPPVPLSLQTGSAGCAVVGCIQRILDSHVPNPALTALCSSVHQFRSVIRLVFIFSRRLQSQNLEHQYSASPTRHSVALCLAVFFLSTGQQCNQYMIKIDISQLPFIIINCYVV